MVANCFLGVCVCLLLLLITVQRRSSKHNKPGFAIGKPIARGKDPGGKLVTSFFLEPFFFPSHILSDLGKRRDADYCQCLELRSATFLFFSLARSLSPAHVGLAGKEIFTKSFSKVLYLLSNAFLDRGVKTRLVCKSEWPIQGRGMATGTNAPIFTHFNRCANDNEHTSVGRYLHIRHRVSLPNKSRIKKGKK